ncbi:MAG: hypothetical protein KJN90_01685 [Gammaproteobacteria bacterium]|nr:hypothetical protein [Gammaproteobacteria bacterium]
MSEQAILMALTGSMLVGYILVVLWLMRSVTELLILPFLKRGMMMPRFSTRPILGADRLHFSVDL